MPARPGKLLDGKTCKAHAWCLRDSCLQVSIQLRLVVNGPSSHGDERDERERDRLECRGIDQSRVPVRSGRGWGEGRERVR